MAFGAMLAASDVAWCLHVLIPTRHRETAVHETSIHHQASQGLAMSARMQLGLRLLQLPSAELEQELARLAEANPLLESVVGVDEPAGIPMSAMPGVRPAGQAAPVDEGMPVAPSLRDHLVSQLAGAALEPSEAAMARLIVEALDDDGFLRDQSADLFALLGGGKASAASPDPEGAELREAFEAAFTVALRFVQSLEPAGVGARSLAECLSLQLARRPADQPGHALARRLVDAHLEALARNDVAALTAALGCSETELGQARALIRTLDPRPARAFAGEAARPVVPEVAVRKRGDRWIVAMNPAASPQLRIDRACAELVSRTRGWSATPMGAQLNEARGLLRSLRQRADTIRKVAEAIVDVQQRWFEHGDIALRPLMLADIAAVTGLHESTVSRVTAGKYMATPRGLVEFRHFFGSRLESGDGHSLAARSVQVLIRELVAAEDPRAPLSDIRLTRALEQRGVRLARRTVTKYRDALGIPPLEARRLNAMAA